MIIRLMDAFASRMRNAYYRLLGMRINGYANLRNISIPRNWWQISLGDGVAIDSQCVLLSSGAGCDPKIRIGSQTYINRFTMIDAHEQIVIGTQCMIGPFCYITDADHGFKRDVLICSQPMQVLPVIIGDDVWLGAKVTVLKGSSIEDGAVIGANSVVNSLIPSGAVAVGAPARVVGYRKC